MAVPSLPMFPFSSRAVRAVRWIGALAGGWFAVALGFSVLAYVATAWDGSPQAWRPSFAYSLAVFSIWALMTWPLLAALRWAGDLKGWRRFGAHAALLAVTQAAHIVLFSLAYWPVYGAPVGLSPLDLARGVFMANYDTNFLFYAVLAGAVLLRRRTPASPPADMPVDTPLNTPSETAIDALFVRSRGRTKRVPLDEIDWIGAAGNYCEIHVGETTHLMEVSLAALLAQLPAQHFARVHRSTVVRLDRVREVRSAGRGDAVLILRDGAQLRQSRRYRSPLQDRLDPI